MEKKITNAEKFAIIRNAVAAGAPVADEYADLIVEFCDSQIEKINNKAAKAKEKAAEKKAIGDELYNAILDCVGAEPVTADAVFAMLEGEDLTLAKVRARLGQGERNGRLVKETLKVEGKNKVHYHKA